MNATAVIPCMSYKDAPKAIEWLCNAFGFKKHLIVPGENGTIAHAELVLGNLMIMPGSASANGEYQKLTRQPADIGGFQTQSPYIVVDDPDTLYEQAKKHGAKIAIDIKTEDYGGRGFSCYDLEGHLWNFGSYDPWMALEHKDNSPKENEKPVSDKRVTSIGGVFFKCKDPDKAREWYKKHLGLDTDQYGTAFEWRQADNPDAKGFSQWSTFKESTKYFEPSSKDFMINYRVENLERLVDQLKKEGVTVTDAIESFEYGKFVHIMDDEGNKIELWEADDIEFEKIVTGRTK